MTDWGSDQQYFREDLLKLSEIVDVGTFFPGIVKGHIMALAAFRNGKLSSNFQMEVTYDIMTWSVQYDCFCKVTGLDQSMRGCVCSWNAGTTSMKANSWIQSS